MKYLFLCSIGPVQDFIATARKSRDLWFGSWLLSELSKAGAKVLAGQFGEDSLIFPAYANIAMLEPGTDMNVPNKIVAVVSDSPDVVGQMVEKGVRKRLAELRDDAFKEVRAKSQFNESVAGRQVGDLLEIYWVGVEYDGGDQEYVRAREIAERILSARKATRDFGQEKGDYLPKSSLDGARESVINENAYPSPGASPSEKEETAKALFQNFGARPAERLSGVDILKRLGLRGKSATSFPSTSDMAARPFLLHVDNDEKSGDSKQLLAAIKTMLEQDEVAVEENDGALLFSSRLAEWIPDKDKLDSVNQKLESILKHYAGDTKPQPYYALLLADGDNMGAAIDNQNTIGDHRSLSRALSGYADDVGGIISRHDGALVYSGGDDVLAYLPLHTVLACTRELADKFADQMKDFKTTDGYSPTLSGGIIVAHHLEPLSDTLEQARMAEKTAKFVKGKNALAITVSKRSGVDRTVRGRRKDVMKRLDMMICWQRAGYLSAGTPYEFQKLYQVLGGAPNLQEATVKESLRILERKRESGGSEMKEKNKKAIGNVFRTWLEVEKVSLLELAHEMIIAKEFASATDMAGIEKKECNPS